MLSKVYYIGIEMFWLASFTNLPVNIAKIFMVSNFSCDLFRALRNVSFGRHLGN